MPFEALYQAALGDITEGVSGVGRFVLELGPLGGATDAGPALWLWAAVYFAGVVALALVALKRRDL